MPNTRASTSRLNSKQKFREASSDDNFQDYSARCGHKDSKMVETDMSVVDNLREAMTGVKKLHTRIQSLERENKDLRSELQQMQQNVSSHCDRGNFSSREKTSRRRIQSLERRVADLVAARQKDRRIIEKLRDTEVEQDAKELVGDHGSTAPVQQSADIGDSAKKLLRQMCDTIDMNTLAEEAEECAVCMEEMTVGNCYSLPCRHPVCVGCFEQLGDGSNARSNNQMGSVQCPHCRNIYPREDCEIITHTAVQQWDLLLDISQQWTAMDTGEMDVGEDDDDDENSFIDDDAVAAAESPHQAESLGGPMDLDQESPAAFTSPNDTRSVAYKNLPSPMKRKRLTELVAQRTTKQRV